MESLATLASRLDAAVKAKMQRDMQDIAENAPALYAMLLEMRKDTRQ